MIEWWQHIPERLDPIIFTIGSFSVYWYALWFLAGFLAVFFVALRLARRGDAPCSEECVSDMFPLLFLSALIGGRVGYVLFYYPDLLWLAPLRIFLPYDFGSGIWVGISGMSYHGGLIGVALALLWFSVREKISFLAAADFVAFLAPVATFFGRLGNFFNVELPGRITAQPWGMVFPDTLPQGVLHHPSTLYEAFLEGVLLFVFLIVFRKKMPFSGALTCLYLALYAILRFFGEFFRSPDPQLGFFFGVLTLGQFFSLLMLTLSIGIYVWLWKKNRAMIKESV